MLIQQNMVDPLNSDLDVMRTSVTALEATTLTLNVSAANIVVVWLLMYAYQSIKVSPMNQVFIMVQLGCKRQTFS